MAAAGNDVVLSASRDSTAISWRRESGSQFSQDCVFAAGSRYINAVAYVAPSQEAPKGDQ